MGNDLDKIKPSAPLSYRFGLPLDYFIDKFDNSISYQFIDRFDDPKSRLFIDAVEYIKQKELVPQDALNALQVFADFLRFNNKWKVSYLYNPDWKKLGGMAKFISLDINQLDEDTKDDIYNRAYEPEFEHLLIGEVNYVNLISHGVLKNLSLNYNKIYDILELLKQEDTPEIKSIIATIYISAEQFDKAIEVYETIEQKNSYDYYNLGNIYFLEKNDLSNAIEYYIKAAELPEAIYNLGISYLRNSDWEKAFSQFRRLAISCPIGDEEDNDTSKNKRRRLSQLVNSEKLYMGNSLYYDDYDSSTSDLNFHPRKYLDNTQLLPLNYIVKQMSCNNSGVCSYYKDKNIFEALEWFEASLSWEEVTGLKIGRDNIRCLMAVSTSNKKRLQQKEKFRSIGGIIGDSEQMKEICVKIKKLAKADAPVLITGETGTGKELVAKAIHENSNRCCIELRHMNCSAIPETLMESELFGHEQGAFTDAKTMRKGIFELANGGTIFFDEIGDMSLNMQVKLLRVLQEKKFTRVKGEKYISTDVRILSATNKDLYEEVAKGKFREDLYYRIRVCEVKMPPLRDRREDIRPLINHFLEKSAKANGKTIQGISREIMIHLENYDWPGNVRQLVNVIENLVVYTEGEIIQPTDISQELKDKEFRDFRYINNQEYPLTNKELRKLIEELKKMRINQGELAKEIGISEGYLTRLKSEKIPDGMSDRIIEAVERLKSRTP